MSDRSQSRAPGGPTRAALLLLFLLSLRAGAEELRFDRASDWASWDIPRQIVTVGADGSIRPVEIRRGINAVLNAEELGGGVHRVGSNQQQAAAVHDGDPATGWEPDATAAPEDWFVELDLGRAVSARHVTLQFDESAPPFELFDLLLSTGEPAIDVVGNPIEGTLVYRIRERYKANDRHRITFELDDPLHTPIRYVRVQPLTAVPGARLTEIEVRAIGDNLLTNLLDKGGDIQIITALELAAEPVTIGNARALVDGDLVTQFAQRNEPRASHDVFGHITVDLGAVFWTDLMRVIGGVVVRSGGGGGIVGVRNVQSRSYIYRFYEILTSDGSISPDGTLVWTKHFSGHATEDMRRRGLADHHYDSTPTRFLRLRWRVWDAACAFSKPEDSNISSQTYTAQNCLVTGRTEELQVFGEGFPQEVSLRSPLLDLGTRKNLNALRWGADTPPGTRVEIRTRTGNDVDERLTYLDKNGKEVTKRTWGRLIPSFRGPIDTTFVPGSDWSPWSNIYAASGQAFQSPSPRRFLEVDVRLVTDTPQRAPGFDWLALDFSPPLAQQALGEVTPSEVRPGERTEFSYFVRAEQTPMGIDRFALEASEDLEFLGARLGDDPVEAAATVTDAGLAVSLSRRMRSGEVVELRFATEVYLQSTRFDLFLEDGPEDDVVRQQVDPGDASDAVESNSTVVSIPVSGQLFADVDVDPKVLTANGDGVNDELAVRVDLVNVLEPRPLRLRLYDLSGRVVHEQRHEVAAGRQRLSWDGRGPGGLVPPGLYLLEVTIEGDADAQSRRFLVSVVY